MQPANYHTFLKHELRLHMEQNQLSPPYQLQIDNEKHAYPTDKGMATYSASFELAAEKDRQTLVSKYGLIDKRKSNIFRLSIKEAKNH